jgi:hypothetical protein
MDVPWEKSGRWSATLFYKMLQEDHELSHKFDELRDEFIDVIYIERCGTVSQSVDEELLRKQISIATKAMEKGVFYVNCVPLCAALARFLITGEVVIGPVAMEANDSQFDETFEEKLTERMVKLEGFNGNVTRKSIRWRPTVRVETSGDLASLSKYVTGTSVVTEQANGEFIEIVDNKEKVITPIHVNVVEMSNWILKRLDTQPTNAKIIGLIGMSRVNAHATYFGHVMLFYACRDGLGAPVVRYVDGQNLDQPIHSHILKMHTFLTKKGQNGTRNTFAPTLDVYLLQ